MPPKISGDGSDRRSPDAIRLTQIRIQGIIYSSEEPAKVYAAIGSLLPKNFVPLQAAVQADQDPSKIQAEYTLERTITKGYYKDTIELLELQFSKKPHIETILSYWAEMLPEQEKLQLKQVLEQQLNTSDPEPAMDIYLRMDRVLASVNRLAILSSPAARPNDDPRDPGSSIQVRLHFERPYARQAPSGSHLHPYHSKFLDFFSSRRLTM